MMNRFQIRKKIRKYTTTNKFSELDVKKFLLKASLGEDIIKYHRIIEALRDVSSRSWLYVVIGLTEKISHLERELLVCKVKDLELNREKNRLFSDNVELNAINRDLESEITELYSTIINKVNDK